MTIASASHTYDPHRVEVRGVGCFEHGLRGQELSLLFQVPGFENRVSGLGLGCTGSLRQIPLLVWVHEYSNVRGQTPHTPRTTPIR